MRSPAPRTLVLSVIPLLAGILIGSLLPTIYSPSQPHREKIVIAIQPTAPSAELLSRAKDIEQFLESRIDADVEIYVPTSYAAVVESLRFGNAHVGLMSAWPAYLATKLAGADIVLAEVRNVIIGEEKKEAPYYYSYWIVLKDAPYDSLEELRGKKVAFPSPISTSGFVAPLGRLVELGLITRPPEKKADPEQFFSVVLFAGGYAQAWEALRKGQVDVAVIAGDVPEKLYFEVVSNSKILEQQGPIPSHAVVFSKDLKEPLRSQVKQAFLELGAARPDLMHEFISALFVRFEETNTERHLAGLQRYLELTGLKYTESLG